MAVLFELQKKNRRKDKKKTPFPLIFGIENDDGSPTWQTFKADLIEDKAVVNNLSDATTIYTSGFFGKASLSKSEPNYEDKCLKMSIQRFNRHERLAANISSGVESLPADVGIASSSRAVKIVPHQIKDSKHVIYFKHGNDPLPLTEKLVLSFEEVYFLSGAIKCLVVFDGEKALNLDELWSALCKREPKFPLRYAAYHHFRSKGWVIRMGTTYGTDFLLYKDGPPFYHATFSVCLRAYTLPDLSLHPLFDDTECSEGSPRGYPCSAPSTLQDLKGLIRVNGQVNKTILFCEIIVDEDVDLTTPECLNRICIQEIVSKRWCPYEARL